MKLLKIDSYLSPPTRSDQLERQLKPQEGFKMSRPARPQLFWRAERTVEYLSTAKGRERRWPTFSTLPQWKLS